MKHTFGKSLALVAVLLGAASIASAQVRTDQIQMAPKPGGTGPIISSGVGSPDLVVASPYASLCIGCRVPASAHLPESGYCGPWNGANQKVRVNVVNAGSAPSGPSQVRINFLYSGSGLQAIANVPPIDAGNGSYLVEFNVPAGAWSPGGHSSYHFTLTADSSGAVSESNEGNNTATSYCMGPAS